MGMFLTLYVFASCPTLMWLWKHLQIINSSVLLKIFFSSQSKQQNKYWRLSAYFVLQFIHQEWMYFSTVIVFLLKLKWNWWVQNSFGEDSASQFGSFVRCRNLTICRSHVYYLTWIYMWTMHIMHYSTMSTGYTTFILFVLFVKPGRICYLW